VHVRGAGGYHDTIQALTLDIFCDEGLTRIRAHVGIIADDSDCREVGGELGHCLHIHHAGDIRAAVTNINPDTGWIGL
jgi:hypothetical protein